MPIFLRLVLLFLFVGLLVSNDVFAAENLLNNPDFDNGLTGWTKNVSTLTAVASDSAALFQSSSSSTKYLYQILSASASATYAFSGWTKLLFGSASAYLRATEDTSSSHDSVHSAQTDWTFLSVTFTTATNAASLKLKINLDPNDASPSALAWDTVRLERVLPLTIGFSFPATVTADLPISLAINVSHASPSAVYYVKGVGDGVSTYNGSSWLAGNGSWNLMPILSTDSIGSGSTSIQTRFNSSSATAGLNNFLVRLRLVGDDNNVDSSPSATTVIIPVAISPSSAPSFDFSLPSSASVGGQFAISVKISNLLADTKYYLKARIGPDSSHLTHGQTNNNGWLSDNDSWTKFPQLSADSSGVWEGKVSARLSDDEPAGKYLVLLRIRKVGDDNNFDSNTKEMNFTPKVDVVSPIASLSGVVKLAVLSEVLGIDTESGEASNPAILDTSSPVKNNSPDPIGSNLISWGMTALGAALSTSFFRRRA